MQSISLFSAIFLCQAIFGGQWVVTAGRSHTLSGLSPHHRHRHHVASDRPTETTTVSTTAAAVSESSFSSSPLLPLLFNQETRNAQTSLDSELPAIDLDQGSGAEEAVAPISTAVQTVERRRKRQLPGDEEPYSNDIFLPGLKERSLLKQKKKHYKSKSTVSKINFKKDEPTEEPLSTTTETLPTTTTKDDDEGEFIIYLDGQDSDHHDDDEHESTLVEDTPNSSFSIIRRLLNLFQLLMAGFLYTANV